MPNYLYWCQICEQHTERIVGLDASSELQVCERCRQVMVKVPTAPAFSLKGPSAGSKPRQSIR